MTDRPMPWRRPDGPTTAELVARCRAREVMAAAEATSAPSPLPPPLVVVADEDRTGHTARCPACAAVVEPILNARRVEVFPPHPNPRNARYRCVGSGEKVRPSDRRRVITGHSPEAP